MLTTTKYRPPPVIALRMLLAAALALVCASVNAQTCKEDICLYQSVRWNGKAFVKSIQFAGFPRTPQGYVTNFHQVRGLPWEAAHETQVKGSGPFEFSGSADVSVQACRKKGALIVHTFCTRWVTFTVY